MELIKSWGRQVWTQSISKPAESGIPEDEVTSPNLRLHVLALIAVLGIALAVRLFLFVGFMGTDDASGWYMALQIAEGDWSPDEIFTNAIASMRYGLSAPSAVFLKLFGNSEQTLMIYPILMSLLGIAAVWDIVRRLTGNFWASHFAGLIVAASSLDIFSSTVFLPDGPMAGVCLVSIWCAIVAWSDPSRVWRSRSLFLMSGLLAASAIIHKSTGLQVFAALGLWGLSLIVMRELRWPALLIVLGFCCGVAAEHTFFWQHYGDPLHRWKTIQKDTARTRKLHQSTSPERDTVTERFLLWGRTMRRNLPAASVIILVALGLGLFHLTRSWSDVRLRLVCLFVVALALMRAAELIPSYSVQPRRLLPFVGCGAILLAVTLARIQVRQRLAVGLALAVLGIHTYLFVDEDYKYVHKFSAKMAPERWLFHWADDNSDLVRNSHVYVDARTARILHVMFGFEDLEQRGIYLFPFLDQIEASEARKSHRFVLNRPDHYRPGSFVFDNQRTINWLILRINHWSSMKFQATLPQEWNLQRIVVNPVAANWSAAIYQVPPAPSTLVNQTQKSSTVQAVASDAVGRGASDAIRPVAVEGDPQNQSPTPFQHLERKHFAHKEESGPKVIGDSSTKASAGLPFRVSDGETDEERQIVFERRKQGRDANQQPPLYREGDALMLKIPLKIDLDEYPTGWADVKVRLRAYDASHKPRTIYSRNCRAYYPYQEFRGYAVAEYDIHALRLVVTLNSPGGYTLELPYIDCLTQNRGSRISE